MTLPLFSRRFVFSDTPRLLPPLAPSRSHRVLGWLGLALFALPLCCVALDPAKSLFQYNIQSWRRHDGLPGDKVSTLTQTADGYLWVGTQNGLVRFNGLEFKTVAVEMPGGGGQDIEQLHAAQRGGFYFAVKGGGFGYFDGSAFTSIDTRGNDIAPRAVFETRDGALWLGGERILGRRPRGGDTIERFDSTTTRVTAFAEDPAGRVWIGTEEAGLYLWSEGRLREIPDETLHQQVIYGLAVNAAGELWVATQRGVHRYSRDGNKLESHTGTTQSTALLIDRHGTLWLGTADGLGRYENGAFTFIRKAEGLASDYITCLFEDTEGSLWVGTQNGLTQISDLKFPIYTAKEGLTHAGALTVSASRKGGIWATLTDGISYFDGQKFTNYTDPAIVPNNYIKLGLEARNGDFYWVDGDKTVNVLSNGKVVARYRSEIWTEAIAEDAESVILGMGSSLARIKDGRIQPYVFNQGQQPDFQWFDNLWIGRDDAIWVACYAGVFRVKDGDFKQWSSADGLPSNRVYYVFEDVDGHVWAGLSNGLVRIKDGQVKTITAADGLSDNRIYAIVPDEHGYFWINSGRGIFRVSRKNLNEFADGKRAEIQCELFDGLESVKFTDRVDQEYSGCRSLDGRIWFPNPLGILMVDPNSFVRNTVPPPVFLEEIRVNGSKLTDRSESLLQVGDERVEFVFAALSYISPKRVQMRYRMDGFDPAWVDAAGRRSAVYNLKPGKYTFHVQAANADGVWNETGDSFTFELPPPFYQTSWFYALCGLGGVAGLFGAYGWKVQHYKIRQKKLQAENDVLEARVARRTDELARSLSLLKATLDSTADGILAIGFDGRVVSHNRQFAIMWGFDGDTLDKASDAEVIEFTASQVKDPARFVARVKEIHTNPEVDAFDVIELKDGRTIERYCKPQRLGGKCVGIVINFRDITARKKSEAELTHAHRQLLESSRQAGMAEVATSVLHNVGNVLNSVNVSTTLVVDKVRGSKVTFVPKVGEMLQEHAVDLPSFLTSDPKGQKIPNYLTTLGKQLLTEQSQIVQELDHLRKNVEHIKEIVAMQQSYARVSGVAETVPLCELVEDALRMNAGALNRHDVHLVREYEVQPIVTLERHKVMQVLVNLIRNAKYACDESGRTDKQVTVRVTASAGHVKISVTDNGVGIPPENLTRIFAHGFTTRKEGHGFGLHSGALVAREMGGSLIAESAGIGHGATFTLELPADPVASTPPSPA